MTFKLGDTVKWRSQAAGYERKKVGKIAQVVPPGERPDRERFARLYRGNGCGFGRDHESYVVLDGNRPYWPIASKLQLVEPPKLEKWAPPEEYAGRRDCGCVVSLVVTRPDIISRKDLAKMLADWIREGLHVEPISLDTIRSPGFKMGCKCEKPPKAEDDRQPEMFAG
jgi:hypothetical protein